MQKVVAANFARRFLPLIVAILALGAMALFSFTPWVWEWMGHGESYPELVFLVVGVPAAMVAVGAGVCIAWAASDRLSLIISHILNFAALTICMWLSWAAFSAFLNRP
ncbi:hypothetical protein FQV39_03405 [Bosea sp. F3-2]|uniref:hypothetical protein n=1 Tax=Bosea sp. F3-2 TaxID=2599640 RepID=UPI0011EDCD4F|nr:hypothetical protein [Bosea sp. F3-2]QEL21729.1 hypothetical protein FQV39_03405 [Bosea sp. F3-2]